MKRHINTWFALFVIIATASLAGCLVISIGRDMLGVEPSLQYNKASSGDAKQDKPAPQRVAEYTNEGVGLRLAAKEGSSFVVTTCSYEGSDASRPEYVIALGDDEIPCDPSKNTLDDYKSSGAKTLVYPRSLVACDKKKPSPDCEKYLKAKVGDHGFLDSGYWLKTEPDVVVSMYDYDTDGNLQDPHVRYTISIPSPQQGKQD